MQALNCTIRYRLVEFLAYLNFYISKSTRIIGFVSFARLCVAFPSRAEDLVIPKRWKSESQELITHCMEKGRKSPQKSQNGRNGS